VLAMMLFGVAVLIPTPTPAAAITSANNTPFPSSTVITGAAWTSLRHGPPANQWGDILSTPWADDGNLYTLMDDGGTGTSGGALWRNSFARITGTPPNLRIERVGNAPPPATWPQIRADHNSWTGPLGSYYSTGFAIFNDVFYATQMNDWNWNANAPFNGLAGVAYSTDDGRHWHFPKKRFPGPTGNLNWVQTGPGASSLDGYVYAISTEREFNANTMILGRTRPNVAGVTDPSRWQWASGWTSSGGQPQVTWSGSIAQARPVLSWQNHITYPRMTYDPGIGRFLLTFTYSYASKTPSLWRNGSELVILEAPHPWGPFSFAAREPYFGPSNGYDPAFPGKWISRDGRDLWMIYAANFQGCATGLSCKGAYGLNYRRLHLAALTGSTPH
jgi:hypothetical protein